MCRSSEVKARKGFTLVELAVVIVIIGVLAAFGVPRFLKSVERSKAAEAFNYLSAVRDAPGTLHCSARSLRRCDQRLGYHPVGAAVFRPGQLDSQCGYRW